MNRKKNNYLTHLICAISITIGSFITTTNICEATNICTTKTKTEKYEFPTLTHTKIENHSLSYLLETQKKEEDLLSPTTETLQTLFIGLVLISTSITLITQAIKRSKEKKVIQEDEIELEKTKHLKKLPLNTQLNTLFPEEVVAELGIFLKRMNKRKTPLWIVKLNLSIAVLKLLIFFHIVIRIQNLSLPSKRQETDE